MLLVVFREMEQSAEMREFFKSANAFEFGGGAWLLPIAADTTICLQKIVEHDLSANQGVAVFALSRHGPPPRIYKYHELEEWLKSAREPGR